MTAGAPLPTHAILPYLTAGRAVATFQSKRTGTRLTFRLVRDGDGKILVDLLRGPDNSSDYTPLAAVVGDTVRPVRLEQATIPAFRAFAWTWRQLETQSPKLDQVEVWHSGRCGKCGRLLTVPESVRTGLGPVCAGKQG